MITGFSNIFSNILFQGPLVRWLKVNFSETFTAFVHVKALRVFVESVLRSEGLGCLVVASVERKPTM